MFMHDGGSGESAPPRITSDVTVDPGEIRAFARFLAEMESDLSAITRSVEGLKQIKPEAFGAYDTSAAAFRRSSATIDDEHGYLTKLAKRLGEVTDGTNELAKTYTDLDELNNANANTVSLQLRAGRTGK